MTDGGGRECSQSSKTGAGGGQPRRARPARKRLPEFHLCRGDQRIKTILIGERFCGSYSEGTKSRTKLSIQATLLLVIKRATGSPCSLSELQKVKSCGR